MNDLLVPSSLLSAADQADDCRGYLAVFGLTVIATWILRDYSAGALEGVHFLSYCKYVFRCASTFSGCTIS